jgi:hypothetical protein
MIYLRLWWKIPENIQIAEVWKRYVEERAR